MGKQASDGVELMTDGRVRLVLDGDAIVLRRPKIGELRRQHDLLMAIDKAQKESTEYETQLAVTEQIADYWRAAVETLGDGTELPPPDDLPVWFLSVDLIVQTERHWREVPYLSGGK